MLSIFTTLKPFQDPHISLIQRNAIKSWTLLRPKCEIILFGNEEGVKEIAHEFHLHHIPKIAANHQKLPFINSFFKEAQKVATFPLLCYVNGDIIFLEDFLEAVKAITRKHKKFLAVGRRWDIDIKVPLDFAQGWQKKLRALVKEKNILHGYSGIDYFVFSRGIFHHIPPLVVGRGGWDNWMIFDARVRNIPIIDMTEATTVVHQEHDLLKREEAKPRFTDESAKQNIAHAGGYANLLTIQDADLILTKEGLKRPNLSRRIFSQLSLFYPSRVLIGLKRKIRELFL